MISTLRPEQLRVSTGTTDNDTVTTKGYVDDHDKNAIWTLDTPEVLLTVPTNTFEHTIPLNYRFDPTMTLETTLATKKYADNAIQRVPHQYIITISSPGQTVFTLTSSPNSAATFGLFLNGQHRVSPTDYTVSGTTLTWNDPESVTLDPSDELIAWYDFLTQAGELKPLFLSYISAEQPDVTGDGTTWIIIFDSLYENRGNGFDTLTGKFTAPITGVYKLYWTIYVGNLSASNNLLECGLYDGSTVTVIKKINPVDLRIGDYYTIYSDSFTIKMDAGDTRQITLKVSGGTMTVGLIVPSHFNGYLVTQ